MKKDKKIITKAEKNFYCTNYGWICPKCGSVYSHNVLECHRCNKISITVKSTTDLNEIIF